MRIGDAQLRPAANNLTLVRLALAASVIYSHCLVMTTYAGRAEGDNLAWLLGAPLSGYGVDGFFFLSGFLVYRSLATSRSVPRFVRARLTRLWPGLAAMVALVTAVGAFVTLAAPGDYLSGRETLRFVGGNLSFLFGAYTLTGVRCGAEACNVNGSLWTLPWEARSYMVLALLGLVGMAARRPMLVLVLPATFAGALLWDLAAVHDRAVALLGTGLAYNIDQLDRLWTAFALGILAYELRARIPLNWAVLGVVLAANLVLQVLLPASVAQHARAVTIGYAVLCAGFLSARSGTAVSARWPDYSYGMYIYAFPVMTALLALLPGIAPWPLMVLNALLTVPLAAASWHLVEHPALEWLRRRQRTGFETPVGGVAAGNR